ncbi:MAG: hypothetical protein Q4F30_02860 [Akkermansia sp.]|nr:hypothetical protein [Akkermansia sp.]
MKPRLPSLLVAAIVALQAANPLLASATLVSGKAYDVGKVSYSSDDNKVYPAGVKDTDWCWAASASNMIEYWQDTYSTYADSTPISGYREGTPEYSKPEGTDYLNVYHNALSQAKLDTTGDAHDFIDWWMKGTAITEQTSTVLPQNGSGHYGTVFNGVSECWIESDYCLPDNDYTLKRMADELAEAFSVQGQAVQVTIQGAAGHSITCWGYETDSAGNLSALILSDSDDGYFGTFRMEVSLDEDYSYLWYGIRTEPTRAFTLETDDTFGYYGHVGSPASILQYSWINTKAATNEESQSIAVDAKEAASELPDDKVIKTNTKLTNESSVTEVNGDGVVVGNETDVIVLTGETGHKLSLNGKIVDSGSNSKSTGLMVKSGAMVSLDSLSISNYDGGAMLLESKTYIHGGQLNIKDNSSSGDGGGAKNESYLEIKGCSNAGESSSVSFCNNVAAGKGGAIYNNGTKSDVNRTIQIDDKGTSLKLPTLVTTSIRGNGNVVFKDNSAGIDGNDIYNEEGGVVIVADNSSVSFESNCGNKASVTNNGTLYLAAQENQNITFAGTKLNGKGTTYIGTDNWAEDYKGAVDFTNGSNSLSITGTQRVGEVEVWDPNKGNWGEYVTKEGDVWHAAELKNATVSAEEITGAKDNLGSNVSYLTNSSITVAGALTMRNVTLDNTDVITVTGTNSMVTLDDVAITLNSGVAKTNSGAYDISGMFSGKFTINSLYFDSEELKNSDTIYLGTNLTEGDAAANLWIGEGQYYIGSYNSATGIVTFSDEIGSVPEPTTGTLSLLALAGLCARRRRR